MTNYINDQQAKKIFKLIQKEKPSEDSKLEASYVASSILRDCNPKDIKFEDGFIIVCDSESCEMYEFYDDKECAEVEREIAKEIMERFGLHSEVQLWLKRRYEQEPDPIPPLYMGAMEVVYIYGLIVRIKT